MDFLTNPFTTALLLLYQVLAQNLVLSIVVFTVLIRLITYPLTAQQMKSSKAMQAIQPKMKKMQEKYKGDREKLAAEQMKLYREHGVNPLSGCLPLLIQLPILLGLYGAISRSLAATPLQLVDLHHRIMIPNLSSMVPLQNQFLWLNLGQPDQTFILPVLVVVTTWLQSKLMTPANPNADPKDPQAAMARNMTMMMPLMIGMFSLSFASGLSIYWVVSNIVGIAQYAMTGQGDIGAVFGRPRKVTAPVVVLDDDDDDESVAVSAPKKKALPAPKASTKADYNDEIVVTKKKKGNTPPSSKTKASNPKAK
jgi:YidC/Oxa1 family membrane protein insertase